MIAKPKKTPSTWGDLKKRMAELDRAGFLGLVQDLYGFSKDNQAFLHARFSLSNDVLAPYKAIIDRWLWPNLAKNQSASVATAKKAIAAYKKAAGQPEELAELMVFYCERAVGFSQEYGLQETSYFNALVKMFEQALKISATLSASQGDAMLARLDAVRDVIPTALMADRRPNTSDNGGRCGRRRSAIRALGISHRFGYGVGDDMDCLLANYRQE